MRYILSYRYLTTIIDAEDIVEAKKRVAHDLFENEKNALHSNTVSITDILLNLEAREATDFDEAWYKAKLDQRVSI